MSMLPNTLMHLIREHDMTPDELSSLRLCRSAGDKVPAELEKEYMALTGHPISEGYGMTEIGLAALNPPTVVDKLGSIGMPSPGFVFSIRSEDGGEVSSGKEGRLFVRTPSRTAGYWNDPGASAEVIREEWLDTGDVMRADADGYQGSVAGTSRSSSMTAPTSPRRRSRTRCWPIPRLRAQA